MEGSRNRKGNGIRIVVNWNENDKEIRQILFSLLVVKWQEFRRGGIIKSERMMAVNAVKCSKGNAIMV